MGISGIMLCTQKCAYTYIQMKYVHTDFSSQTVLYDLFKRMLGSGPVYAALGNHDTYNEFAPPSFGFSCAVSDSQQSPGCTPLIGR